jgi:hypothetical protein
MNLPSQSAPVQRFASGQGRPTNEVTSMGCSALQWLQCAGVVALCGTTCGWGLFIMNPLCIACMGGLYDECTQCF